MIEQTKSARNADGISCQAENDMDEKTIRAILAALAKGQRIELLRQKDGNILVQTVQRKRLTI